MKTQPLSVDLLRIDAGTQSRLSINEDVVEDYAETIEESDAGTWPFPVLDVFHDGCDDNYMVADGFHRLLAARKAKRGSVPCKVHKGTAKDARIFSMTANDRHGMRMSRADKRACIEWLLDNGGKMTQTAIAEAAGVSRRLVSMVVAERKAAVENAQIAHSSTQNASNQASGSVGAMQAEAESPADEPFAAFGEPEDWDDDEPLAEEDRSGESDQPPPPPAEEPPPPIVAKTGREAEVWEAQQVLKQWSDAVGRWMNGNPAGIDAYREKFPGPPGDRVIDAAKELYNAMVAWKKGLK